VQKEVAQKHLGCAAVPAPSAGGGRLRWTSREGVFQVTTPVAGSRCTPAGVTVLRPALGVVQRGQTITGVRDDVVDVDDARRAQDALTMLIKQDCQLTEVSLELAFCGCRWRELCR